MKVHGPDGKFISAQTEEECFWEKIDKNGPVPPHRPELGPCWIWLGAINPRGYGVFGAQAEGAHRAAWRLLVGPIPDGLGVLHKCDNPPCCNPSHHFLGTAQDNADDKVSKGRQLSGARHPLAIVDEDAVRSIRAERAAGATQEGLAEKYVLSRSSVRDILKGKTWRVVQMSLAQKTDLMALSLRDPWAFAVTDLGKNVENRKWPTTFRGTFAVQLATHCTAKEETATLSQIRSWGIDTGTWPGRKHRPGGHVVALAELIDVVPKGSPDGDALIIKRGNDPRFWFTDQHGFLLGRVIKLATPLPCVGALGFFSLTNPVKPLGHPRMSPADYAQLVRFAKEQGLTS